jgi:hypothetical protein
MRTLPRAVLVVAAAVIAAACVPIAPPPPVDLVDAACSGRVAAAPAASVVSSQVDEASGIGASRAHPNVLWVHNDGSSAQIFAVGFDGADLGTWTVPGVTAHDWEDMAVGPGAAGDALYLGDIGDNADSSGPNRPSISVLRVPEPDPSAGSGLTASPEVLMLTYPDGPHDAEALLVDPVDGTIVIVTKVTQGAAQVFVVPSSAQFGSSAVLAPAGTLALPFVTAADTSADGTAVLVRTYFGLRMYRRTAGQSLVSALTGAGCAATVASEPQGEAASFVAAPEGYVTVSEGLHPAINRFTR